MFVQEQYVGVESCRAHLGAISRVFATYRILLGWTTCKYYHETDKLPNPTPTQRKNRLKLAFGPFSPWHMIFRGLGLVLYRKQTARSLTQPSSPPTAYSTITTINAHGVAMMCKHRSTTCLTSSIVTDPNRNQAVLLSLTGEQSSISNW